MTKQEIGALVETLITIKDSGNLLSYQVDAINDACNLIYHNINELANKE